MSRDKYFLKVLKNHINPFCLSALGFHNICRLYADKIKKEISARFFEITYSENPSSSLFHLSDSRPSLLSCPKSRL
jgi:hypothetical protein